MKIKGWELGDIDVLITHDWPSGIGEDCVGKARIRDLTQVLRPRLHICGHMHTYHEAVITNSMIHALNAVPPAGRGRNTYGWWRLYRKEDGVIECIGVGN